MKFRPSQLSPAELAVVTAMRDMRVRPGDMLLLGPKSVRLLQGLDGGFQGKLPDKYTFTKEQWNEQDQG